MKTRKKIVAIVVFGRLWFDKANGNTYCGATWNVVYRDGSTQSGNIEPQYGYGDYYLQAARDAMYQDGAIPDPGKDSLWYFCDQRGIAFLYSAANVAKKEL